MTAEDAVRILCWDYAGTGDLAPWDYDDGLYGNGWDDCVKFIEGAGWSLPVIGNELEFEDAFMAWIKPQMEALDES